MKTLFLVLGLILFGFITALQYKHLWKDVPELFKDLKKKKNKWKKRNEKTNSTIMDMKKWQSWVKMAILISIAFTVGYYGGSIITEWYLSEWKN